MYRSATNNTDMLLYKLGSKIYANFNIYISDHTSKSHI